MEYLQIGVLSGTNQQVYCTLLGRVVQSWVKITQGWFEI